MSNATATREGVIRADEIYQKATFQSRTGMKETGFRTAKRNGLRVIHTAGRVYIRGADWFDYLERLATADSDPAID